MPWPREIVRHWWDHYRERPFWRLVRLFIERIFRGGGDSDTEGIDIGVGLVLTLLAMPGGFVSLLLLDKYGTLLQWLRGLTPLDVLAAAFPDEYFFIVLSMTVTGAIAVWRWDAILPDRRDYSNLAHLPLSTRTIFFANLVAVLFLVGLIAIDVNALSCVLFPAVVGGTQKHFFFFVQFAFVHGVGVILASVFAFFAVFAILGVLMAALPSRIFRRISTYARGLVVVYLVALLCTSFVVPDLLRRAKGSAPAWSLALPSCWFLGFCQVLRGRASPALAQLASLTLPGLAIALGVALCAYTVSYQRHFVRVAEIGESTVATRNPRRSRRDDLLYRLVLRTSFQKACFDFVWKTLQRSETHRLALTGAGGLGLVLACQALLNATVNTNSWRAAALSPDALSVPFILSFLMIVGLRSVFEVPVELRSNWIFQLMLNPDRQECMPLARKLILVVVLPMILLTAFPVQAYFAGFAIASIHTSLAAMWTVLLTNILLIRVRKLPFTCTMPVFKQHSIVILLSFCFGFLIYAVSIPEFEASAVKEPARLLGLVPVAAVAWYIPRYFARNSIDLERRLIFEESATRTIEVLRLSE
jgi:hypothetical protein